MPSHKPAASLSVVTVDTVGSTDRSQFTHMHHRDLLLSALKYLKPSKHVLESDVHSAALILWLENTKIRQYPIEDHKILSGFRSASWDDAFHQARLPGHSLPAVVNIRRIVTFTVANFIAVFEGYTMPNCKTVWIKILSCNNGLAIELCHQLGIPGPGRQI